MGIIQLAVALTIVLGICSSAEEVKDGATDGVGSTTPGYRYPYYWYRYPYYRGSVNTVSHGSRAPAYGGLRYILGKWRRGLGSYYLMPSSGKKLSQKAQYPTGYNSWGGYSQNYPVSAKSQTIQGTGLGNSGGIYRGNVARVYQFPVRYLGNSYGKPRVMTYGVLYPRIFRASYNANNGVSGLGGLGGYVSSYSNGLSAGQSAGTVSNGIRPTVSYGGLGLGGYYGGYGVRYPFVVYNPTGLRYGNLSSGYNYYYPTATTGTYATQTAPRPLVWGLGNAYSGYGYHYPTTTSVSYGTPSVSYPAGLGIGGMSVSQSTGSSFGNAYGGYGSYYPTATSGRQTTQSVPNLLGSGLGSLQGGWSGYGQGYGVQYPTGASAVSSGIDQPMGYGISYLGYGTQYPIGQIVSHRLQSPTVYGGWAFTDAQSPIDYGGYGNGGFGGGYRTGGLAGRYDNGGLVGGYGFRFPISGTSQEPIEEGESDVVEE